MSSPPDDTLVIKNGTLIDGTGGKPRPNGRIVVRSGKIAEVGPEAPLDQGGGGRVIDAAGRFFDNRASAHGDLPDDATGVLCRTVEDFIIQTRRQCARGVNMIKIADSRWSDEQTMSREAIAAVVEEAHRHGVKVAIHSRGSGSTRDSALAGVDWIFHADLATEADLDTVAAAGTPIMPAFAQGEIWAGHGIGVAPISM
jgi:imidazolonepropionase-like amidohydrolase